MVACELQTIEAVNTAILELLDEDSIARAHRVGRKTPGKSRPVLMQLMRARDKLTFLGARKEFKKKRLGVSNDLTPLQREMVAQPRAEGKFGFYKGGQFSTKPMQHSLDS